MEQGAARRLTTCVCRGRTLSEAVVDPDRPGDFNQVTHTLSAHVCRYLVPHVDVCSARP